MMQTKELDDSTAGVDGMIRDAKVALKKSPAAHPRTISRRPTARPP